MRVAVAQIEAVKGNIEKNVETHLKWIKQAIRIEADMVVFPELSLTGYERELAGELATNPDDKRLDEMQRLSDENGITIGVGLPTRKSDNVFISMIIFQPHTDRITYSKQYLYPPEEPFFTAAKNPMVLNLETEVVSPAICYEASNDAHWEYASQNNATIYIASVLSSVAGIEAEIKKLSGMAKTKNMVTLMSNYVGSSGGYECAGRSSVWNEKGELMGQLDEKTEGLLLFDTETKEIKTVIEGEA
ncbi:carbon-nitrogen hydrolase family protein [Draconibacterium sp.]|uniref:carbon-nitrogen hydrolase family protein n=1 Tax=Draconibacterium sp. TaxID=1965318 RepID=UPI00356A7BAC